MTFLRLSQYWIGSNFFVEDQIWLCFSFKWMIRFEIKFVYRFLRSSPNIRWDQRSGVWTQMVTNDCKFWFFTLSWLCFSFVSTSKVAANSFGLNVKNSCCFVNEKRTHWAMSSPNDLQKKLFSFSPPAFRYENKTINK